MIQLVLEGAVIDLGADEAIEVSLDIVPGIAGLGLKGVEIGIRLNDYPSFVVNIEGQFPIPTDAVFGTTGAVLVKSRAVFVDLDTGRSHLDLS